MRPPTFKRARLEVLNYVAQFHLHREWDTRPGKWKTSGSFSGDHNSDPPVGSLCALESAGFSEWYLSWLIEPVVRHAGGDATYALKSIETGKIANWSNVGISYLPPDTVWDSWQWSDDQFAFNDRWHKATRSRDPYIYLPVKAKFDGDAVTLAVRVRFGLDDRVPVKTFEKWRKVTMPMMLDWYDQCVKTLEKKAPTSLPDKDQGQIVADENEEE